MGVNQAQRDQWNAESQATTWPRRERFTSQVTPVLLEAIALQPGERVLDVGCGGGLTTLHAARAVGSSGSVVGFDLSAPLVGLATGRAAEGGVANVRFVAGDAQVDDAPGGPFDVLMSQFGVMFFADPAAAFANMRRHLRPGARLAFACWQPASVNPWFPGPVLAKYASAPPARAAGDGPPPGPFAFGDVGYVSGVLTSAGFMDIQQRTFSLDVAVPDDSIYDEETLRPLRLDAERHAQAWAELKAMSASVRGDDGLLHMTLSPQLFEAVNP